ncbi:MAG: Uma2 family endonuclease [Planctomycetes bacterium]|nr:Uma2 family endonuclease [Planctomycetota bacterium]
MSTMQTELPELDRPAETPTMGAPKLQPRYTVDEYLALERAALERHIFLDGEIIAMAGESLPHGDASTNLVMIVATQLKGTPCRALTKDTKVRSGPIPETGRSKKGLFSYPDILVVCGEPEFHDAHKDVILNPSAIIEVLSESTEAFDRGTKFTRYQTFNPTLTDYVLVSQHKAQIEHFSKRPDGEWTYRLYVGLDAAVVIASIGCTLKLADVYDRIVFPATDD